MVDLVGQVVFLSTKETYILDMKFGHLKLKLLSQNTIYSESNGVFPT